MVTESDGFARLLRVTVSGDPGDRLSPPLLCSHIRSIALSWGAAKSARGARPSVRSLPVPAAPMGAEQRRRQDMPVPDGSVTRGDRASARQAAGEGPDGQRVGVAVGLRVVEPGDGDSEGPRVGVGVTGTWSPLAGSRMTCRSRLTCDCPVPPTVISS